MIGNDWDIILGSVFEDKEFHNFMKIIDHEYATKCIYPAKENIFAALKLTSYKDVKVVLLGQDPYHGENEAHGLSFSVPSNVKLPPSLRNIYKEIYDDLGIIEPNCGDLTLWAKRGVLLLNSSLTVIKDHAASHQNIGWSNLTDYIIKKINEKDEPVVYILWGNFARSKKKYITNPKHYVIESVHPSPLSAYNGFFGSHPFSRTNLFLKQNGSKEINWQL